MNEKLDRSGRIESARVRGGLQFLNRLSKEASLGGGYFIKDFKDLGVTHVDHWGNCVEGRRNCQYKVSKVGTFQDCSRRLHVDGFGYIVEHRLKDTKGRSRGPPH